MHIIPHIKDQFISILDLHEQILDLSKLKALTHSQTTKFYTGPNWNKLQTTF